MGCELRLDASSWMEASSPLAAPLLVVYLKALALMPAMMLLRLPESDMRDGGLSEFILSTAALVMSRFEKGSR